MPNEGSECVTRNIEKQTVIQPEIWKQPTGIYCTYILYAHAVWCIDTLHTYVPGRGGGASSTSRRFKAGWSNGSGRHGIRSKAREYTKQT